MPPKKTGDIGLADELLELCKQLVSIENHAFSSYVSSKNDKFLGILNTARKIRTRYLSLIAKSENQIWCLSKHLCESLMRLQEVCTRFLSTNQMPEAKQCAEDYESLFLVFIELNELMGKDIKSFSSA